jgi:non-ribosomal peptide synthetase component E (peptide arylation enzyme)
MDRDACSNRYGARFVIALVPRLAALWASAWQDASALAPKMRVAVVAGPIL